MKVWNSRSAVAVMLALVTASPVFAAGDTIQKGVDLWMTVAGFAQTSFKEEPIPAGFFCDSSEPFTGTIVFQGVPLAAEPRGSLGAIDTVVRRLDDAVFDAKGVAYTRVQLLALSLASTRPIDTACGAYDVAVRLDGGQPTTSMRIVRTNTLGGTYAAPLALNVKLVFTPVQGDKSLRRELAHHVDLTAADHSVWAYMSKPRYEGTPRIDTNSDGAVDTTLPVASNFLAGVSPVAKASIVIGRTYSKPICPPGQCPYQSCHCNPDQDTWDPYASGSGCDPDHLHCIWVCVPCDADQGQTSL